MNDPYNRSDTSPDMKSPSFLERVRLYVGGMGNDPLSDFAPRLMAELSDEALRLGKRRAAKDETLPPGFESGSDLRKVRLPKGQILWLALDAYREEPYGDERWYQSVELRDAVPRTDMAILAAVSAFEGTELSGAGKSKKNPQPALERIRHHLEGKLYRLESNEERLLNLARDYVRHYRLGELDEESEEGIEILLGTCKRVSKIVKYTRQLIDYLTFGQPGTNTTPEVKEAQVAVRAAELFHIEGVSPREVGRRLDREPSPSDLVKGGHSRAKQLIEDGERLFKQFLGEDGWREHVAAQRARLEQP